MRFKKRAMAVLSIFIGIAFFSCAYHNSDDRPCNNNAPENVSFNTDVLPIFRANCSTSGCHSGTHPEGNLNLEDHVAYSQLMQPGKGYVDTVNPSFSVVYIQMNSTSLPMPPDGLLEQCKRDVVLKWIEQGAKNN